MNLVEKGGEGKRDGDLPMRIHQIKTRYVNTYLIETPEHLLIIDVAYGGAKYVLGYVRQELRREPEEIALVICTHSDPDHSGEVVKLAQQCGAESGMPYAMSSRLGRFESLPLSMMMRVLTSAREGLRPRAWRMYANPARSRRARRLPTHVPALNGDLTQQAPAQYRLKHGQRLPGFEDWQVVHTPGHSWDSCCYFHLPTRALISGDTLLGSTARGKLVRPAIYASARQTERSIARLKKLNPRAVYPGHGSVVEGEELLEHL